MYIYYGDADVLQHNCQVSIVFVKINLALYLSAERKLDPAGGVR